MAQFYKEWTCASEVTDQSLLLANNGTFSGQCICAIEVTEHFLLLKLIVTQFHDSGHVQLN